MSSLQDLCLQNIVNSIVSAPPLIQEMVLEKSRKEVIKEIKKEVKSKVEKKTEETLSSYYQWLLPMMISDLLVLDNRECNTLSDYIEKYKDTPSDIIEKAFEIATDTTQNIIPKYNYTYRRRRSRNNGDYSDYYDSDSSADTYDDYYDDYSASNDDY